MTEGEAVVRFEEAGLRDHGARVALPAGGDETWPGKLEKNANISCLTFAACLLGTPHSALHVCLARLHQAGRARPLVVLGHVPVPDYARLIGIKDLR